MRTLEQVIDQLRQMQPDLRRRYPIREIGVFGSYVRGEQTDGSDLDILVDLEAGVSLFELAGLQQDLSDGPGVKVDLVMKDALKHRIGRRILSETVTL
jgi:predicted nucleotidyltransferase